MVSYIRFQKSFLTKPKEDAKTENQHAYDNPIYRDNGNVSIILRAPYLAMSCCLFSPGISLACYEMQLCCSCFDTQKRIGIIVVQNCIVVHQKFICIVRNI